MTPWWRMVAAALSLAAAGCDKLHPPGEQPAADDKERIQCRTQCGTTYKSCVNDCKNDAPQACESRCDKTQSRCNDRCDGK